MEMCIFGIIRDNIRVKNNIRYTHMCSYFHYYILYTDYDTGVEVVLTLASIFNSFYLRAISFGKVTIDNMHVVRIFRVFYNCIYHILRVPRIDEIRENTDNVHNIVCNLHKTYLFKMKLIDYGR